MEGRSVTPPENVTEKIKNALLNSHKYILEEILITLLSSKRSKQWAHYEVEEFYNAVLSSCENIYKNFTSHELDLIIGVLKRHESENFKVEINPKSTKLVKCNQFGFIIGHTDMVQSYRPQKKMKSLKELCTYIISKGVPNDVMRCALATLNMKYSKPEWLNKSKTPTEYDIPVAPYRFEVFCYPEFNVPRQQIEPRIIDPSHILTNMRVHATTKDILGCDHKAFERVSESDNDVLNLALLTPPLPDKQSVPYAQKIFSRPVEDAMRRNGDFREADMVMHVRNFFNACNERGLSVSTRLTYLVNMSNYLTDFYKPLVFPMKSNAVANVPSVTFQAIVHNVSTRIHLYHLSSMKTYNQRAVSTLAVENMFSDLSALCNTSSGIPLAANIPRYISRMTQLNSIHQNPEK